MTPTTVAETQTVGKEEAARAFQGGDSLGGALQWVVGKRDEITFGRDARMSDPSAGLIERLADGKFEAIAAAHIANHG